MSLERQNPQCECGDHSHRTSGDHGDGRSGRRSGGGGRRPPPTHIRRPSLAQIRRPLPAQIRRPCPAQFRRPVPVRSSPAEGRTDLTPARASRSRSLPVRMGGPLTRPRRSLSIPRSRPPRTHGPPGTPTLSLFAAGVAPLRHAPCDSPSAHGSRRRYASAVCRCASPQALRPTGRTPRPEPRKLGRSASPSRTASLTLNSSRRGGGPRPSTHERPPAAGSGSDKLRRGRRPSPGVARRGRTRHRLPLLNLALVPRARPLRPVTAAAWLTSTPLPDGPPRPRQPWPTNAPQPACAAPTSSAAPGVLRVVASPSGASAPGLANGGRTVALIRPQSRLRRLGGTAAGRERPSSPSHRSRRSRQPATRRARATL